MDTEMKRMHTLMSQAGAVLDNGEQMEAWKHWLAEACKCLPTHPLMGRRPDLRMAVSMDGE